MASFSQKHLRPFITTTSFNYANKSGLLFIPVVAYAESAEREQGNWRSQLRLINSIGLVMDYCFSFLFYFNLSPHVLMGVHMHGDVVVLLLQPPKRLSVCHHTWVL